MDVQFFFCFSGCHVGFTYAQELWSILFLFSLDLSPFFRTSLKRLIWRPIFFFPWALRAWSTAASPVAQPFAESLAFDDMAAADGVQNSVVNFKGQPESDGVVDQLSSSYASGGVQLPKPALKLRDYFPETWLWSVELVGTEGSFAGNCFYQSFWRMHNVLFFFLNPIHFVLFNIKWSIDYRCEYRKKMLASQEATLVLLDRSWLPLSEYPDHHHQNTNRSARRCIWRYRF